MSDDDFFCDCGSECGCALHASLSERYESMRIQERDDEDPSTVKHPGQQHPELRTPNIPNTPAVSEYVDVQADPRDTRKFAEHAKRKRDNYVFANCAVITSLSDILEIILLKNNVLESDNQLNKFAAQLETPEIQAEFEAMFHELSEPHWSAKPHLRIGLRMLKNTTSSICLKERKRRYAEEIETKQRKDDLWEAALQKAMGDSADGSFRTRRKVRFGDTEALKANPAPRPTRSDAVRHSYVRPAEEQDEEDEGDDGGQRVKNQFDSDDARQYTRTEGVTFLRKTPDPMDNVMKVMVRGIEGVGATMAQTQQKVSGVN